MNHSMRKRCFQYFSDLHLEKKVSIPKIPQVADNLLLAGDIGHPNTEIYQEFFKQCSQKYERVFVVDGNHEWDYKHIPDSKRFERFKLENVKLLENSHVEWEEYVILGATLWTETTRAWTHEKSVKFFMDTIQLHKGKKIIVITHHLPTWHLIAKHYRENCSERTLSRYASHLDYHFYNSGAPLLWVSGHSHSIMDRKIGKTRCVINTRGDSHATKWCG